eukprot:5205862-Pyramimonas_sp.AAC.1
MASRSERLRMVQPSAVQKYAVTCIIPPFWNPGAQAAASRPGEPEPGGGSRRCRRCRGTRAPGTWGQEALTSPM